MIGTITFSSGKGWFFCESDDHQLVFVHQTSVEDNRFLHVDDRISFDVIDNPRKPGKLLAQNVRYLGHTVVRQTAPRNMVRP